MGTPVGTTKPPCICTCEGIYPCAHSSLFVIKKQDIKKRRAENREVDEESEDDGIE